MLNQPFQYKGQFGYYGDGLSNMYYCLHRFYDPGSGRWLSRDPIGYEGGANTYTYCEGNPVMMVDPYGTDVEICGFLFTADGFRDGAKTGLCAIAYVFTGKENEWAKHQPGYDGAVICAHVSKECLIQAAQIGAIDKISKVVAATKFVVKVKQAAAASKAFKVLGATTRLASITKKAEDIVVLGRVGRYTQVAEKIGGKVFTVPDAVWKKMVDEGTAWAANQKFLDRAIARGAKFVLADPVKTEEIGDMYGYLGKELRYLLSKGYKVGRGGRYLYKP
ncbi:MAG: hypothetical protein GC165_14590 [Armatimonadetes bacterium]|nr:hypothetical protein [Armatimonadota bacterium]